MELDIVLLPPRSVSKKIGRFMLKLAKAYDFWFVVDNSKLKPHISLLHLKATSNRLRSITRALQKISQEQKKIKIQGKGHHLGRKFLVASFVLPKELYYLHQQIVKTISVFRTGIVNLPFGEKNDKQKQYIKTYGVGNLFEFYTPHITLAWARKKSSLPKILGELLRLKFSSLILDRLAVAQVNNRYQVIKILREFKLK